MKANLKNVGKWSRWIGGAALVLALAGPLAPTTTSADFNEGEVVGEVIEVEGTAPGTILLMPGGYTGGSSGSPSGPSSGGGGGGGSDESPSSGGDTIDITAAEDRINVHKETCFNLKGTWGTATFKDLDTNVTYAGYSCRYRVSKSKYMWDYFDSEGHPKHHCVGDLDVQVCEKF